MSFSINFCLTNRRYQIRISHELLTELAISLLNDATFETVMELIKIQLLTKNHLLQLRKQVEREYRREVAEWTGKITDAEELDQILLRLRILLRETDIGLLSLLEQEVVVWHKINIYILPFESYNSSKIAKTY